MSDTQESSRQRTAARLRFVAPPGMSLDDSGRKTIGRYEVIRTLGKGAMGVVYKARDPLLDRVVAVKTIGSPRGGSKKVHSAYIERFKREAKAAAKMQHPSIVTIFDVGIDEEAPFMVLEYLPGETLADRLDRVRLPLGKAVQIGMDLANALAFAHRQRIVHRDVKPANVLHAGDNRWKLADFGIARLPDSDLTQVGIFMGTPGYSPPEAIRFGHYTAQADVFAWGAVLYEMLSGRIPYEGPDTRTTNGYVIKASAPSPRTYDPSIPEPLADVIMAALHPSATERYKDAAAAEQALREAWELCLNSGLVPASSIVGEEVPHERVGAAMHVGPSIPAPPAGAMAAGAQAGAPSVFHSSGHASGQPAGQPAGQPPGQAAAPPAAPPVSPPPSQPPGGPMLVIQPAEGRVSDDAPTQVLIRDGVNTRPVSLGPDGAPERSSGNSDSPGQASNEADMAGQGAGMMSPAGAGPGSAPAMPVPGMPGAGAPASGGDQGAAGRAMMPIRDGGTNPVIALLRQRTGLLILAAFVGLTLIAVLVHVLGD